MYLDLAVDIQDFWPLALDVFACLGGLNQIFDPQKQGQKEQDQWKIFEIVYKRGQFYVQILKLRKILPYFCLYDLKLVCVQLYNLCPKQAFICIHILNYNGTGNYIHMRKRKKLSGYICNITNRERIANQFCMFQQKKTDIYFGMRGKYVNSHLYQHKKKATIFTIWLKTMTLSSLSNNIQDILIITYIYGCWCLVLVLIRIEIKQNCFGLQRIQLVGWLGNWLAI